MSSPQPVQVVQFPKMHCGKPVRFWQQYGRLHQECRCCDEDVAKVPFMPPIRFAIQWDPDLEAR